MSLEGLKSTPTPEAVIAAQAEALEKERQEKEAALEREKRLVAKLKQAGIAPDFP